MPTASATPSTTASTKPMQVMPRVKPRCRRNRPGVSRKAAKIADGAGRISGEAWNNRTPISHSRSAAASTTTTSRVSLSPENSLRTKPVIP